MLESELSSLQTNQFFQVAQRRRNGSIEIIAGKRSLRGEGKDVSVSVAFLGLQEMNGFSYMLVSCTKLPRGGICPVR